MTDLFQMLLKYLPASVVSSLFAGTGVLLVLKQVDAVLRDDLKATIAGFLTGRNGLSTWPSIIKSLQSELIRIFYFFTRRNFIVAISIAVGCLFIATSLTGVLQDSISVWPSVDELVDYCLYVIVFLVANLIVQFVSAGVARVCGTVKWYSLVLVLAADSALRIVLIAIIFALIGFYVILLIEAFWSDVNNFSIWYYPLVPLLFPLTDRISLALALGLILSSPVFWLSATSLAIFIVWAMSYALRLGALVFYVAKFPLSYAAVVAIVGFNCVYIPVSLAIESYMEPVLTDAD